MLEINESVFKQKNWEEFDIVWIPEEVPNTAPRQNSDGYAEWPFPMHEFLRIQSLARMALQKLSAGLFNNILASFSWEYVFCHPDLQTQATDGYTLFVNPNWTWKIYLDFGKSGLSALAFIMAHECMHAVLKHVQRVIASDDQATVNIAADYEVNSLLVRLFPNFFSEDLVHKLHGYINKSHILKPEPFEIIYKQLTNNKPSIQQPPHVAPQNAPSKQSVKNKQSNHDDSNSQNGSSQVQKVSDEYKAGWSQAMEDYKAGKIKI